MIKLVKSKKKLKGMTIVEILVALVIISIVGVCTVMTSQMSWLQTKDVIDFRKKMVDQAPLVDTEAKAGLDASSGQMTITITDGTTVTGDGTIYKGKDYNTYKNDLNFHYFEVND